MVDRLTSYTSEELEIIKQRKSFETSRAVFDFARVLGDFDTASKVLLTLMYRIFDPSANIEIDEEIQKLSLLGLIFIDAENRAYIANVKKNRINGAKHKAKKPTFFMGSEAEKKFSDEITQEKSGFENNFANNFSNVIKITQEKSGLFDSEASGKNSGILAGYDGVDNSQISENKIVSEVINNTENLGATPKPNQASEYLGEEMPKKLANYGVHNNNIYNNIDYINNNNIDNIYIYGKNKIFSQNFSEKVSEGGNLPVSTNLFGEVEVSAPPDETKQTKKSKAKAGSVRKVKAKEGQEIDFAKFKEYWNKNATEAKTKHGSKISTLRKEIPIWLQDQIQEIANDYTEGDKDGKKIVADVVAKIFKSSFHRGENSHDWCATFKWLFERDRHKEYTNFEKIYNLKISENIQADVIQITDEEKYKDEHPLEYAIANGLPENLVPIASKMGYDAVCIVDHGIKWGSLKSLDSVCALSAEEQMLIYQFKQSRNEL